MSFSLFHFILPSFPLLNFELLGFIRRAVSRGGGSEGALVSADQLGTGPHWDRQGSTEPHWELVRALGTLPSKEASLKHAEKFFYLHEKHHRNQELNLIIAVVYFK